MKINYRFLTALMALTLSACVIKKDANIASSDKPNIVIFYVDDLGYGDLSSYGATSVNTPNVDRLAKNGIRFTDGHTTAATCTPSRYSLLTGEYAFRKKARILKGDAPLLIDPARPSLPKMLAKAGYTSAVVGKWHLGLGSKEAPADWNNAVKPGPLEIGFDYSFLLPATGDRVPTVYLENHHVVGLDKNDPLYVSYSKKIGDRPTGYERPDLLRQRANGGHNKSIINGISRIGWMQGGKSAEWVDEDFYKVFTDKANTFIQTNKSKPFFLFFSFHDIHVPRLPHSMFQGKTAMGVRGDAIVQMDWITGQVVNELEKHGILDNTLIIFTSDNGAVLDDGYFDKALALVGDHKANGIYRGGKYSAYEGGTRVPTIVHYPAKVSPGVSEALVSQVDIYASLAAMLNVDLAADEAIDSQDISSAFLNANNVGRTEVLEESKTLSYRQGLWKYIRPARPDKNKRNETGYSLKPQLFDLSLDPSEQNNLAKDFPEKVIAFEARIKQIESRKSR